MNPREGMTAGRAELPQRYSIQGLQMPSRAPSDLINTSVLAIQRKFPIHQEITGRREREYSGRSGACWCMMIRTELPSQAAQTQQSVLSWSGGVWAASKKKTRTAQNGPE